MKHKINALETRKPDLNVHPTGLMSIYLYKHFLFHDTNKLMLKGVRIRLIAQKISFHFGLKKEMSKYHRHPKYAVSFAVTGAKWYTGSDTNMKNLQPDHKDTMKNNMQEHGQ